MEVCGLFPQLEHFKVNFNNGRGVWKTTAGQRGHCRLSGFDRTAGVDGNKKMLYVIIR